MLRSGAKRLGMHAKRYFFYRMHGLFEKLKMGLKRKTLSNYTKSFLYWWTLLWFPMVYFLRHWLAKSGIFPSKFLRRWISETANTSTTCEDSFCTENLKEYLNINNWIKKLTFFNVNFVVIITLLTYFDKHKIFLILDSSEK